ncbi:MULTISPECIES: HNH endonuclease signature motif containing protein [unclassified Mycobacterium]|uniref:HNH endonuclease signature motif containing protein n=1 Tax=unclassified Mycobacterium TaxID=2642494 RepID=UPI0029C62DF6|nr:MULTISPECIES: DUF222 domain-containing protein [unclassified Mycobacterium]
MFEKSVSDGALIDEISASARAEATAAARRFAAVAELTDRRCTSEVALERQYWACDAWDGCAAEIGAALMISPRAASTVMHQGLALRDRLPRIGALLAAGEITAALATLLCWRTHLIEDPAVLDRVDAELAAAITGWGRLSAAKLETTVDALIDRHDPAAVLAYRAAARGRDIGVGTQDDTTGTVSLWGRLQSTDGELLKRRLEAMATAVCRTDPRTLGERRSDALGVVMAGGTMLPCRCEDPDCPHSGTDARAEAVVIHVLTDHHPDPNPNPNGPTAPDGPSGPTPDPTPAATPSCAGTAVIAGGGIVPAPLLAELARMGAVVRPIADPAALGVEPGYRPSAKLARFVRARDLTCCQPGCHRPAEYCDLDHAIPYGRGPTHPANLRCLCRKHHLLKTFWTGASGWQDQQSPDGTIVWTAPTGHQYRSPPGSRLLFPHWDTTTPGPPANPANGAPPTERALKMPLRKRTRSAEHAARIRRERQRNQATIDNNAPPF